MSHEDLAREHEAQGSSDRAFGAVFAGAFLLIALVPLFRQGQPRWWAIIVGALFGIVAATRPTLLATLNKLWIKLGQLLGKIVGPIAMGLIFYCVLTPLATVTRLTGRDPLRLRFDRHADSYWILRKPPGPPPQSMNNQF
jgi:hypothetical protein